MVYQRSQKKNALNARLEPGILEIIGDIYKFYENDIKTMLAGPTVLLNQKDGINDIPFSSGYNVVASQPDRSAR